MLLGVPSCFWVPFPSVDWCGWGGDSSPLHRRRGRDSDLFPEKQQERLGEGGLHRLEEQRRRWGPPERTQSRALRGPGAGPAAGAAPVSRPGAQSPLVSTGLLLTQLSPAEPDLLTQLQHVVVASVSSHSLDALRQKSAFDFQVCVGGKEMRVILTLCAVRETALSPDSPLKSPLPERVPHSPPDSQTDKGAPTHPRPCGRV